MTDVRPLLNVEKLEAFYGESKVLHDMSFEIFPGEVVTLLGRNGAGKTTTMRSIIGILRPVFGSIRIYGVEVSALSSNRVAQLGVGYCPEERGIFSSLNVAENLDLPPKMRDGGFSEEKIFHLFPQLAARLNSQGTKLSGGEQQMLAIGRILRTGAKLLLLDEPTEGLAPVIVKQIGETIKALAREGFTVLLVEQNFRFASKIADRHYLVERGRVVDMIPYDQISTSMGKLETYLGV
jgi:branched-chain amino acid transport system ATP-binding protein